MAESSDAAKKANKAFKEHSKALTKLLKHVGKLIAKFDRIFARHVRARAKFVQLSKKTMEMKKDVLKELEASMSCPSEAKYSYGESSSSSTWSSNIRLIGEVQTKSLVTLRRSNRGKGKKRAD